MFQVQSWPNVILHLDGDAFFASVMQAVYPRLKNKPVVTGRERGIATAVSYQARELGIKRGMKIWEIKKKFPDCVIVDSDYEVYSLFSKKIFAILRKFTPLVEEYSIDEGFADIKGLRRPLNMSYDKIGLVIKNEVESCLGITVSVGISLTKSLAKLASDFQKPSGLMVVDGRSIENFLAKISLTKIWGVGLNTSSYLEKLGLRTALEFAQKSEKFIRVNLTKPFYEIWRELRGEMVYLLNLKPKNTYQSIVRSQTFTPPTNDQELLYAKLLVHVEEAFAKARSLNYQVGQMSLFLKTQNFHYLQKEISFLPPVSYPILVRDKLRKAFEEIYQKKYFYRTTGCGLSKLSDKKTFQPGLFNEKIYEEEKIKKIYPLWEEKKVDFGTSLFDKDKIIFNKKPKIFKVPVLSL